MERDERFGTRALVEGIPLGSLVLRTTLTEPHNTGASDFVKAAFEEGMAVDDLDLSPLRFVCVVPAVGLPEVVVHWQRQSGETFEGVTQLSGGLVVARVLGWIAESDGQPRAVIVIAAEQVVAALTGDTRGRATLFHEFGHVHEQAVRWKSPPVAMAGDAPGVALYYADKMRSEYYAERIAARQMSPACFTLQVDCASILAGKHAEIEAIKQQLFATNDATDFLPKILSAVGVQAQTLGRAIGAFAACTDESFANAFATRLEAISPALVVAAEDFAVSLDDGWAEPNRWGGINERVASVIPELWAIHKVGWGSDGLRVLPGNY